MVLIEEIDSPRASDEKDAGNRFFSTGNTAGAIQAYSRAVKKLSDESVKDASIVFSNRAQAYLKSERFEEALADCNEAISRSRKNGKAHYRKVFGVKFST